MVLEKTLESPLDCKEIQPIHSKGDQSWVFLGSNDAKANSSTLATSCEELTHWKRLWCWEGLGAGREGDDRGWDGWMASPTRGTWVWVNSGRWWWTGRPGVLRFMGLERVGHDWVTELNWTEMKWTMFLQDLCVINTFIYHLPVVFNNVCLCSVTQSLFTTPLDYSQPGSSDHGISQTRILVCVAISSSTGSSQPRDQTCVFCIGRWILYHCTTWESQFPTIILFYSQFLRQLTLEWSIYIQHFLKA